MLMQFGIENECTAFDRAGRTIKPVFGHQAENQICNFDRRFSLLLASVPHLFWGSWLKNGGKVYLDCDKIEYASPECVTLRELVLADKAGDFILHELLRESKGNSSEIFLMKRSAAQTMTEPRTWGAHENYMVSERLHRAVLVPDSLFNIFLELHLISRQVYSGAGHLQFDPAQSRRLIFWTSPRVYFLKRRLAEFTRDGSRSIINARQESLMAGSWRGLERLHLICGDMNRSDWSLYLKVGATALVLAYLEIATREELSALIGAMHVDDPLEVMQRGSCPFSGAVAKDLFQKLIAMQGKILRAVAAKKDYLTEVLPEAESALENWRSALADVSRIMKGEDDLSGFSLKLDWLIKKRLFEEVMGAPLAALNEIDGHTRDKLLSLDLSYHRLNVNDLYRHLVEAGRIQELYPPIMANRLILKPPQGRAEKRVALFSYVRDRNLLPYLAYFNWERLTLQANYDVRREAFVHTTNVLFDDRPLDVLKSEVDHFRGVLEGSRES